MTKVLKLTSGADRTLIVQEAAQALAEGGLVVFPTETVYGLAGNRDNPDVVARISDFKRFPAEQYYSLMLADVEDVPKYVKKIPLLSRRVMRRFWPGPLTIVFGDEGEDGIGIRIPASDVAREIIKEAGVPVLVTSAGAHGKIPAHDGRQALEYLDGKVDIIIDGGEARLKEASTVAMFRGGTWQLLREGLISQDMITRHSHTTILFVCTGNSCRSPLAEGFCKKLLADKLECNVAELDDFGYNVISAGTEANAGLAASEEARTVAREFGFRLDDHSTRPLTRRLVLDADVVIALSAEHLERVKQIQMNSGSSMLLANENIADPVGGSLDDYRKCARSIEEAMKIRLEELV